MRHRSERFDLALIRDIYRSMGQDTENFVKHRGWSIGKTFISTRSTNVKHLDVLWALHQIREWAASLRENRAMRILPPLKPRFKVLRHGEDWPT